MMIWRVAAVFALAVASVRGQHNDTAPEEIESTVGIARRLAGSSPGNVAACYTPFHNNAYPLWGGGADVNAVRAAIEDDFRIMSKYFTHVRTYYSMHFGIEVAPIAAKYGVKLYLGVFLTKDSWGVDETNAAVNAVKKYSDTVEALIIGSENLVDFKQRSWDIINKVNEIKSKAGGDAWRVKYGTSQRVNEYLDSRFDWDMGQLRDNLDILGVNIYPFFNNDYDANNPAALLDAQWNWVINKWPRDKIRLTETGFPTAGQPSSISPRVKPSLEGSYNYYKGVVNWNPSTYVNMPKFWFQAFDRRQGDPAAPVDLELYFGFWTTSKNQKRDAFPMLGDSGSGTQQTTTQSSSGCGLEENVDYSGPDIGSKLSRDASGCFSICNNWNGCGAFTWTNYNDGTCWLKANKGNGRGNGGARSGTACKCNQGGLEANTDYTGNDLTNRQGNSPSDCISKCQGVSGCKAFTWSNYQGGTCWLKSGKGATSWSNGVTSGVIC